jgi:hypothetical protein
MLLRQAFLPKLSASLEKGEKCFMRDASGANQSGDDVLTDLVIPGHYERTRDSRLFQLDVTPFLPCHAISELLEHAHNLLPSERG